MTRSALRRGPALLALAAALSLAGPARSDHPHTVPHKEHCTGTLTDVVPGTLFFAGVGRATHFGRYSIEGNNDFDALGNVLNGEFTTTAADGSTISGTYE